MKVSVLLWILMGLVTACFIKGIVDMVSAFGSGESAQSILIGAIPMYLLGALVVFFLGKLRVNGRGLNSVFSRIN